MKKILGSFFLLLVIFPLTAHAEKVRVYTDYDSVRILRLENSSGDFELEAAKSGLKGTFKEIDDAKLPKVRDERSAWKLKNGGIVVDPDLKSAISDKATEKEAALEKLKKTGLTDKELELLGLKERG